jgi:putative flippase GtrA
MQAEGAESGVMGKIAAWRRWLPGFIFQTARYGVVGVFNATLYTCLVYGFVTWAGWDPDWASLCGFCIALPVGYLGHWGITFQGKHRFFDGWQRFAVMNVISFIVVVWGMHLMTHNFRLSYWFGIAVAWVLSPAINYIVLQLWVFTHRTAR